MADKPEFMTPESLARMRSSGRLLEAADLLDTMSGAERAALPRLPQLTNWELVLEEVLDTDHEPPFYCRYVNELFERGYGREDLQRMREVAWETAGWLNFEMMVWDWSHLDEEDMHRGLNNRYERRCITREHADRLRTTIAEYSGHGRP